MFNIEDAKKLYSKTISDSRNCEIENLETVIKIAIINGDDDVDIHGISGSIVRAVRKYLDWSGFEYDFYYSDHSDSYMLTIWGWAD
jgi:hypothetical protein